MTGRQALYPISLESYLMQILPPKEEVHVHAHLLHFPVLYPLLHEISEIIEAQQGRT